MVLLGIKGFHRLFFIKISKIVTANLSRDSVQNCIINYNTIQEGSKLYDIEVKPYPIHKF